MPNLQIQSSFGRYGSAFSRHFRVVGYGVTGRGGKFPARNSAPVSGVEPVPPERPVEIGREDERHQRAPDRVLPIHQRVALAAQLRSAGAPEPSLPVLALRGPGFDAGIMPFGKRLLLIPDAERRHRRLNS